MKQQLNLNVTAFLTEEEAKTGVQRLMGMRANVDVGFFTKRTHHLKVSLTHKDIETLEKNTVDYV